MIALWKAEYQKTRKRYLLLFVLGMTAMGLIWALHGELSDDAKEKGWYMLLYQMPVINVIVLPMLAMLVASRLGDLEHKNNMLWYLCTMTERGKLYDAKLLYGLGLMLVSILLQWFGIIADGFFRHHFGGNFLLKEYILLLLFTIMPTFAIYILLHTLAMCCEKPAVPYIVGIVGGFVGLLSLFLPYRCLYYGTPWGYYGSLMLVGAEYNRETRISTYFYREVNWGGFAAITIITVVIFLAGRMIFCRKEL